MGEELLAALFISILAAFATSYFAYRFYGPKVRADLQKEFESRFNERKWEAYTKFSGIMYQIFEGSKTGRLDRQMPKYHRQLREFLSHLWLVGSDEVVEAFNEWLRYGRREGQEEDSTTGEGLVKLISIMIEMRKDLGYKSSQISPKDLLATFITDIDEYL